MIKNKEIVLVMCRLDGAMRQHTSLKIKSFEGEEIICCKGRKGEDKTGVVEHKSVICFQD